MDTANFDRLSRALGSRRAALASILGLGLVLRGHGEAEAHNPIPRCKRLKNAKKRRSCLRRTRNHNRKQTRIVRTFTNATPISIASGGIANPYPSKIRVGGFRQGRLLDVDVELIDLTHEHNENLYVLLEAPDGRRAIMMRDVGGPSFVIDLVLNLDDEAPASLPIGSPLGSGTFRPTDAGSIRHYPSALATFDGINPNGIWQLYMRNDAGGHSGRLAGGWSLRITARVRAR